MQLLLLGLVLFLSTINVCQNVSISKPDRKPICKWGNPLYEKNGLLYFCFARFRKCPRGYKCQGIICCPHTRKTTTTPSTTIPLLTTTTEIPEIECVGGILIDQGHSSLDCVYFYTCTGYHHCDEGYFCYNGTFPYYQNQIRPGCLPNPCSGQPYDINGLYLACGLQNGCPDGYQCVEHFCCASDLPLTTTLLPTTTDVISSTLCAVDCPGGILIDVGEPCLVCVYFDTCPDFLKCPEDYFCYQSNQTFQYNQHIILGQCLPNPCTGEPYLSNGLTVTCRDQNDCPNSYRCLENFCCAPVLETSTDFSASTLIDVST